MIKLPNTLQEIFDIVANHLLTQGKKSMDSTGRFCNYRGKDGTKCAAGVLIPDDQYCRHFEQLTWQELVQKRWVEGKFVFQIQILQKIHDEASNNPKQCLESWKDDLKAFAEAHYLTFIVQ